MTNTIPNVPRELLCELRDAANDGMNATTRQHQIDHFAGLIAKADALLSAPSPAGVDGLEVRAYEDSGGALYTAKLLEIMAVDSVGCEPLCRLSGAQAIIDGLRGENERIRLNIAEYNEAISCYQSERDQQAQRIGELEGLLRDFAYHTQRREMPTESSLAEWADRIDAALAAVCAAAPNIAPTSEHSGS